MRRQSRTFLRIAQVLEMTGLKRAVLYRMMEQGCFPRPVQITSRAVAWLSDEVAAWQEARIVERNRSQASLAIHA